MIDRLVEIEQKDLPKLQKYYSSNDSKSFVAYTTITNYMNWFEQEPNMKHVKFFCLNGDFSGGTFALTDRWIAYVDTVSEFHENLTRLLQLLDYSKGLWFFSERIELQPTISNALKQRGIEVDPNEPSWQANLYRLRCEDALKLETKPNDDIQLGSVKSSCDLEKILSLWPYRRPNAFKLFERMAKLSPTAAAYRNDGTLVAWVLRYPTGLLAALQTDEKFFGRGYGSLVTKSICKKIAELGQDIFTDILEENIASQNLFRRIGFELVGKVVYISTKITWNDSDE